MSSLDDLVESELQKRFNQIRITVLLISRKLKEFGITLSEEQVQKLENDLDINHLENFEIAFNEEQMAIAGPLCDSSTGKLTINFEEEDISSFEEVLDRKISDFVQGFVEKTSSRLLESWKNQMEEILYEQQEIRSNFESNLRNVWGQGIDLLEMLCGVCLDVGSNFNHEYRPEASTTNDFTFEALTRLHARGCQIGFEILTLLKSGFADGAMARWRTLHEISVMSMFISNQGQLIAERYLAHTIVTNYDDAFHYQKHCNTLGFDPIPPDELMQMKVDRDAVCQKYGSGFEYENGWAASAFSGRAPRFVQIEEYVNLQHFRPIYKLANNNIHAGSKGVYLRLGSPLSGDDILVAGPSHFGLADPGQNTAISLYQITVTLLLTKNILDHLVTVEAIEDLMFEIYEAFASAESLMLENNRKP